MKASSYLRALQAWGLSPWAWGIVLILLSWAGIFPSMLLARLFAGPSGLSSAFTALLEQSQWSLAGALIMAGILWEIARKIRAFPLRACPENCIRWLPFAIAIMGFVGAWTVQGLLFDHIPHITDATSHWFQARIFAAGRLAAPAPPCPQAFFQHNVVIGFQDLWHTKYYPGQALWLFWPLRLIAMPLGFALFLMAANRIARHYFDPPTALVATALMAASPLLLLLSASFMSHMTLLMWMAWAWAFALVATGPRRTSLSAVGAGFCVGMGLLTRPQDAVLAALFILATLSPRLWRLKHAVARPALWAFLGLLPPLSFLLYWNHTLYGHILAGGYHFAGNAPISQTPIIRDTLGLSESFPLARAVRQSFWVALKLNQALLGWPATLPLLIPGLIMPSVRRDNALLLLGAAFLYLPYFFFHYYGFELEARYAATAAPLLILIIARTLIAATLALSAPPCPSRAVGIWITACFLYAGLYYWSTYLPPRYSPAYEEASPNIHRAANDAGLQTPAIVLLPNDGFLYSSGFIHNDPGLQNPVIYARDIPAQLDCLETAYSDRRLYRYVPTTNTPIQGAFLPAN